LDYFARKSFVERILQRNHARKPKKTRILRPKYGWGTRNPQPGQSHEPKSLTKLLLVPIKLVPLLTRPLLVSTRLAPSMIGLVLISVAPEAQWW
jgi:hypothetical protein